MIFANTWIIKILISKKSYLKKESTLETTETSLIDTLSDSKPTEITTEEISYYRKHDLCLVCKGKVGRFNIFMCPNCKTLYCKNCAQSLSNTENICWVCSELIDEKKPGKPLKREEEVDLEVSKSKSVGKNKNLSNNQGKKKNEKF